MEIFANFPENVYGHYPDANMFTVSGRGRGNIWCNAGRTDCFIYKAK